MTSLPSGPVVEPEKEVYVKEKNRKVRSYSFDINLYIFKLTNAPASLFNGREFVSPDLHTLFFSFVDSSVFEMHSADDISLKDQTFPRQCPESWA